MPCVVFCHANCSSRIGGREYLETVLLNFSTLFTFDFSGSGLSEGTYISLGHYEKDDLEAIIEFIRGLGSVSAVGLWGRSMGASTILLHLYRDPLIAGIVVDSPFSSLKTQCEELVSS
jgi:fermentation-respiration switch protein FrsA (DUF1100 family)